MRSPSAIWPTGCAAGSPSCRPGRGRHACSRGRNATSCSSISPRAAMMWASRTAGSGARPATRCGSSSRRWVTCPTGLLQPRSWSGCAAAKCAPVEVAGGQLRPSSSCHFCRINSQLRLIGSSPGSAWQRHNGGRQLIMSSTSGFRGCVAVAVAGVSLALLLPAQAQFWGDWGGRPQRQQQWNNNWFGGGWNDRRYYDQRQEREAPVDYSRAPASSQKKPEATTPIVVVGDANADWLAYGLEDAFSENPEFGIVRKHRTDSGLIRYDQRRDLEWPQVAREIIAAEKPKFIVMMIGNSDRQTIREKVPPAAPANARPVQPAPALPRPPPDPERQLPEEQHPRMTEQARQVAYGPWEFRSEKWELAYIKRINATIAALKSAGVPVIWVGLPSQRSTKATEDSSYLNELYRSQAEKAGIVFVDVWDGFVDEAGKFSTQGPDYLGQTRRLRTSDGVYFTKFGARKLALYVEREIERVVGNKGVPVALPVPVGL